MAALMYIYGDASLRGVERCMEVVQFVFPSLGLKIPSFVTIRNWVLTLGLDVYKKRNEHMTWEKAYAIINDESITIALHKILLQLAIPAQHPGHPLTHSDIEIVDINVAPSHKSEDIVNSIERVEKLANQKPEYAVTDNGTSLRKGLERAGIEGHRDISHTFGTFLKTIYDKDEEFISLTKCIGNARHYALTDVDYLMPNNMRALARYMNVFKWIQWCKNMQNAFYKLNRKEQKMYSFVTEHSSLVDELAEVANCFEMVLEICKNQGLSMATSKECVSIIQRNLMGHGERLTKLGELIIGYFRKETLLLKSETDVHTISSDIIESIFGYFKNRKSPNRMYGVTGFVMALPLHTKLSTLESARNFDFKGALERTHRKELKEWEENNLPENLAVKRSKILRDVC